MPPQDDPAGPGAAAFAAVGGALLAAGSLLGLWILLGRGDAPFAVDVWWNDVVLSSTAPVTLAFAHLMDVLGGGWFGGLVVPGAFVVTLLVLRRPWGALYLAVSLGTSALVVQVLKHTIGRARPEDMLVVSDFGSFPSGHVAHATTLAVALWVVFPRRWVAVAGGAWIVLMAFSRTYLHAHWLSDTLGGALVGSGVALLIAAAFVSLLRADVRRAAARTPSLG